MEKVFILTCLLAIVQHITAQCGTSVTYTQTFIPQCQGTDVYINWPNYENQASYYSCNGAGNPVLNYCASGQYFCYVLQECVDCSNWIPPVQCSQLKTQNTPNCVPMGSVTITTGGTTPTPVTPVTPIQTTPSATTPTAVTDAPTDAPPTATPTVTDSAPTTVTQDVSGPPSPVTNGPDIPMPPTPQPTPPSVSSDPSNVPPVV